MIFGDESVDVVRSIVREPLKSFTSDIGIFAVTRGTWIRLANSAVQILMGRMDILSPGAAVHTHPTFILHVDTRRNKTNE